MHAKKGGASPKASAASGCPMHAKAGGGGLNELNNMPAVAAQARAPGQEADLSTERVTSSIPMAANDSKWTYPSPQMFWNSLVRKGKVGAAQEDDMDTVVAVHNSMNEATWLKILEWEAARGEDTKALKLARFTGRPDEFSPKSRLKQACGHPPPFDRHDWIVVRPDGSEARYVIDYYSDEAATKRDETPRDMSDVAAVKSILLDVRPALDSLDALYDRCVRMPLARLNGDASEPLPFLPSTGMGAPPKDEQLADVSRELVEAANAKIAKTCSEKFNALATCGDDEQKCADAAIALQHCVASVVCPKEAANFKAAADLGDADKLEAAYATMDKALDAFQQRAADAQSQAPSRRNTASER